VTLLTSSAARVRRSVKPLAIRWARLLLLPASFITLVLQAPEEDILDARIGKA
jgi:hypothetical protein